MGKLCWFEISIGGVVCDERIYFRLFDDKTPKTCDNFRTLCEGNSGKTVEGTGVPMTYKGSSFHRIIPKFMIQGGDFTNHNGTGGVSIYGEKFEDENFEVPCDRAGLLAMANAGPNTNGSQFFITTVACHHLTGKHVVFGSVLRGMSLVRQLEHVQTGAQDTPVQSCVISDCGSIDESDLPPLAAAADGDSFQDYVEDNETPMNDAEKLAAGEAIRTVGNNYFKEGAFLKATQKYGKALRYLDEVTATSDIAKELTDKKVACHNNSAMCFIRLQMYAQCKASAAAAIALDRTNTKAIFRRGVAFLATKDFDEAKKDFEEVLKLDPQNGDALAKLQEAKATEKAQQQKMAANFKKMFA